MKGLVSALIFVPLIMFGTLSQTSPTACNQVHRVAWSPDMRILYMVTTQGVRIYSMDALSDEPVFIPRETLNIAPLDTSIMQWPNVYHRRLSPDRRWLYIVRLQGDDRIGELWHTQPWTLAKTLPVNIIPAFSPDGRLIAFANYDTNEITLMELESFETVATFRTLDNAENVNFSPDGRLLAVNGNGQYGNLGPYKGVASIWQVSEILAEENPQPEIIVEIEVLRPDYTWRIHTVVFVPDSSHFITIGDQIIVWDWRTGQQLKTFPGGELIALSNDGQYIATGYEVTTVWNTKTWEIVFEAPGTVRFSPDSTMFFSADRRDTVGLYRTSDGTLLHRFECVSTD